MELPMKSGKEREKKKLLAKAKELYLRATSPSDLGCGIALAEYIQGYPREMAKMEFNEVWAKVREIDPSAPKSPFDQKEGKDEGS